VGRRGLGLKERALLFGDLKSLTAVITEPSAPSDPILPAIVFLDAGVLHHVGPNRVHVRLARELARDGFLCMRFDFSGLGDSRPRRDAAPFAESVVAESRMALDVLEARGARSFLLFGICSGADAALRVALQDPRVAGAALVEPYLVAGPGYLLYAYRRRLLNPLSWLRLLRGRSELWAALAARRAGRGPEAPGPGGPDAAAPPAGVDDVSQILPSRPEIARQVRSLAERGVGLCFVYAREGPAYHNWLVLLRREVRGAIARGTARVVAIARTDHVFTPRAAQDRLVATVRDWARDVAGWRPAGATSSPGSAAAVREPRDAP
jgi:dienelactone hydrolase